jgi:hypothetical protein
MRRQKAVITYADVVADVITAPENNVVTDGREGLQGVVLENEAVIPELLIVEDGGP